MGTQRERNAQWLSCPPCVHAALYLAHPLNHGVHSQTNFTAVVPQAKCSAQVAVVGFGHRLIDSVHRRCTWCNLHKLTFTCHAHFSSDAGFASVVKSLCKTCSFVCEEIITMFRARNTMRCEF